MKDHPLTPMTDPSLVRVLARRTDHPVEQASNSLQREAGCLRFDVASGPQRSELIFLYEIYLDRAAFEPHLQSQHFKDFDARVGDWVTHKQVRPLQLLWPIPASG